MRRLAAVTIVSVALLSASAALAQATIDPNRERARIQSRIGWEAMRAEHWEEAARAFRAAIEIDPNFEYAHYSLGRAYMGMKSYENAVVALRKCANLYSAETGRKFANAQDAQRWRRDRIMEIDEQIRLLRSGPQSMQAQNLLREFENQRRDLQDRIDRGTNMTIQSGVPAFVSLSLGSAYFRAGKLADAEREYKAATVADPRSGEAYNNLAVVYLETERFTEAEDALKSAKKAGFKVHPQLEQDIKARKK